VTGPVAWVEWPVTAGTRLETAMVRKLKSGCYRLYSRKLNPKTGNNLGTLKTRAEAEKHERAVQYFKRAQMGGR
jgi:hypothetical protein